MEKYQHLKKSYLKTHFIRVNSGAIINLDYVVSFNRNEVTMINGDCITISRSRKKTVVATYNQFIERSFGL